MYFIFLKFLFKTTFRECKKRKRHITIPISTFNTNSMRIQNIPYWKIRQQKKTIQQKCYKAWIGGLTIKWMYEISNAENRNNWKYQQLLARHVSLLCSSTSTSSHVDVGFFSAKKGRVLFDKPSNTRVRILFKFGYIFILKLCKQVMEFHEKNTVNHVFV